MTPTDKRAGYKRAAQLIREWLNEPGNYDEEISIALDRLDNEEFIEKAKYDTVVRLHDELKQKQDNHLPCVSEEAYLNLIGERDALKAERDELFALLASGAPRVTITKVDEADAWREQAEKLAAAHSWIRDGLQHFTNDEDQPQREHLTKRIDDILLAFEVFQLGRENHDNSQNI